MRLRWPRCGFRFAASREDIRLHGWRTCTRSLLHLGRHEGPADLPGDRNFHGVR